MGKIGDLFVKLGLKSDDYKKGIEQAKRDTHTFGASLKTMSTAAKAAWAAVATAVVKFATDAIKMTQRWGDEWRTMIAGVNAAYGSFVRQLASGEGFSNLFSNMREAARLAREAAIELDEIFERTTSYNYTEAQTNKEIAQLQLIMRDSSKSDKERMDAAQQIIQKTEELGRLKKEIATQEADGYRKQLKSQTQMNDDEINFLVREYNQNKAIIDQARAYLNERKQAQKDKKWLSIGAALDDTPGGFMSQMRDDAAQKVKDLDAATSQAVKDVAAVLQKYDKGNDELIGNLARAEVAVINVDTEVARAQTRATAMLGTLTKATNAGQDIGSGEQSDSGLNKALGIQQAAEDSFKSEVQLLNEKYSAEKALLEQYQLDTTALTKKYYKDLFRILDNGVDEELTKLAEMDPIELDVIDMSDADQELQEFIQRLEEDVERAQQAAEDFAQAITNGFSSACSELMDQLMGLSEFNPGAVVQALLTPLADLAIKAGEIIMAEGLATIAAKSALETFGVTGWGAVTAGAALVAAGTAAKAGLKALASGASTTSSTYTGNSSTPTDQTQNIQSELTVYVKGTLKGSDIVLASERTQTSWSR